MFRSDILTMHADVFDILTMRLCLWYTYDAAVFMIYLRSGCVYDVIMMYFLCTYDVYLRCFANSLYSAQYTITTLSPSLYVFFTYPAIRNRVYILITWYKIRFLVEVNVACSMSRSNTPSLDIAVSMQRKCFGVRRWTL